MPMIEFRYDAKKISQDKAAELCAPLEEALRSALQELRPNRDDYGVFVEGDPFDAHHNQADLSIYVFYHPSWQFEEWELALLPEKMGHFLASTLRALAITASVRIRCYRRDGYAGTFFNV
jgi:hypothetical protein